MKLKEIEEENKISEYAKNKEILEKLKKDREEQKFKEK